MNDTIKSLLIINKELQELVNPILDKPMQTKSLKHLLLCFAVGKAYKTHKAIQILCEQGYGEDAAILVRSLFEIYVTHAYIAKDPTDKRAERFQDYDWIKRKKMFDMAKNRPELLKMIKERESHPKEGQDTTEIVTREAELAQSRYNFDPRYDWSTKSIRGMAEEIGNLHSYETVYNLTSNVAHSSVRAINEYLSAEKSGIHIQIAPGENWVEESLVSGFNFFYDLVVLWDREMKLSLAEKIKAIEDNFVKIVNGTFEE